MRQSDKRALLWIGIILFVISVIIFLSRQKGQTDSVADTVDTPQAIMPVLVDTMPDGTDPTDTIQQVESDTLPEADAHLVNKKRSKKTEHADTTSPTRPAASVAMSVSYTSPLRPGQTIDLATADSAQLCLVPGIGPTYARKIIRYRTRLGGFVSTSQLKGITGLPTDIAQWFTLSTTKTTPLPVNHLTFGQLLRHPYLSYQQVKAILAYRKEHGAVHSLSDLASYAVFSDSDLRRLKPYLDFAEKEE